MQKAFYLGLCFAAQFYLGQTYEIQYTTSFEGKPTTSKNPIITYANADKTLILNQNILDGKAKYPFEFTEIQRKDNTVAQYAYLSADQLIETKDNTTLAKQEFKLTDETKKILNHTVRKAVTSIRSNTMEVWFTQDLKVKGGPTVLGQDLGLVLEVVRNGNFVTRASSIKKVKEAKGNFLLKDKNIQEKDALTYQDMIWKSRFTQIPVFQNEQINFTDHPKSSDGILRFANGTIILKKVKFPEITKGQNVFVELKEQSNGDAYDRTGSVFIIPQDREISFFDGLQSGSDKLPIYDNGNGEKYKGISLTPNYLPALELMRFFTPFGISHFNKQVQLKGKDWQTIVPYRQEISELTPELSGKEVWVGTYIGNYDKGGHKVSLEFTIHPGDEPIFKNNYVLPLFTTTNIMEMAGQGYPTLFNSDKGLQVEFTLGKDLKNAQLRYITTGHGGWGNGDEFQPRKNSIFLDGKQAFSYTPWRTDCGTYRLFNPSSGNFSTGLSSSDLSRSTWCPGTLTAPIFIDLGDLKAGKHSIEVKIPQGKPEGNSISFWNVSGTLLGEIK